MTTTTRKIPMILMTTKVFENCSKNIYMLSLSTEDINSLIETQLMVWQEAKENFDRLREVRRKSLICGDFPAGAQLNPARIRSTAASVDTDSIAARPCFLCPENRPAEQLSGEWPEGWDLLVNPYPILPVHFTIVCRQHIPQGEVPLEMAAMAEAAPSLAIFFNGARAGASAPDHLHCQGVLKSELPIISIAEKFHPDDRTGWMSSEEFGADLPFHFLSAVITPDPEGLVALSLVSGAGGVDESTREFDTGLVNAFFWISDNGVLRIVIVPRKAHRPSHYFRNNNSYMISPGAIDMAGLIILPQEDDFERINAAVAREIYAETAFSRLPLEIRRRFIPAP